MKKREMKEMKRRRKTKAKRERKREREREREKETVQGARERPERDRTVDARAKPGSAGDQRRPSDIRIYRNRVRSRAAVLVKAMKYQDIERCLIMYQPSYNRTKLLGHPGSKILQNK